MRPPRWPYDMRPSARAEKYIRDAITGRTDRRTDRVRRNMRPPPREEGRIIMSTFVTHDLNSPQMRRYYIVKVA